MRRRGRHGQAGLPCRVIVWRVVVQGEAPQKATLADRMAALHVPGISVAVIHNGRIDWARSYGVAGPDGSPVTPDTLFQAASISKPLTALVTMRLAQDKKLDLDIDVDNYLKDFAIPRDADAADETGAGAMRTFAAIVGSCLAEHARPRVPAASTALRVVPVPARRSALPFPTSAANRSAPPHAGMISSST